MNANNTNEELLTVKNLNIFCQSGAETIPQKLLNNISFSLNRSDILGVVGETGSGKSILMDAIGCNLKPPLKVEAEKLLLNFSGRSENLLEKDEDELRKIWGKQITFIPAEARERLNPIMKVGRQVCNVVEDNLKISRKEARKKVIGMFKTVFLPDPAQNFENYPHELSGGMAQRIVISIALSTSPKLILADEPTMGLDVTIQAQILDLMADLIENLGSSAIIATRDLGIVANYCNKLLVLGDGNLVEFAEVKDFFKNAIHPYSRYLLAAAFTSHGGIVDLETELSKKETTAEAIQHSGCSFVNRCSLAKDVCYSVIPPEAHVKFNHYVKCHQWERKILERGKES